MHLLYFLVLSLPLPLLSQDAVDSINAHPFEGWDEITFEGIVVREPGEFLVFSQGMSLLKMPLAPTRNARGQLLLTKPNSTPVGLDVDCQSQHIYWSDVNHKTIDRTTYNGSVSETVISDDLGSPEGLAVDWASRNIYWTDSIKDTIEVARLDGTHRRVLIHEDLVNPRGIVVHPGSGRMFWTDWNREAPRIEMANMDGTDRHVFIDTDLGLPNMLTIDIAHNDLCWSDAGLRRIECVNLHGHLRRIIYTPASYPFDLTVAGNFIYWTDWDIKIFIQKVHRHGGMPEPIEIPLGGNGKLYSIVTVPEQCPRMSNPCSYLNGGCQHLCLPNGRGGRSCACPDDVEECSEPR